ncbi:MAG: T9SS type A sorting domain-containing protein [Bacteroidetes bacterium]|nr:T9SS type A sorting domain-containing protein [Bacteroidota bacterium]
MYKKLLSSVLASLLFVPLFAQEQEVISEGNDFLLEEKSFSNSGSRSSHVFNYGNLLAEVKGTGTSTVQYFFYYLFPDSLVITNTTNGTRANSHHTGQVLDPTANLFWEDPNGLGPLPKELAYTLDAIDFPYRYFRVQDSAPDTLFVQVYKQNAMDLRPTAFATNPRAYARMTYNSTTNKGIGESKLITILLNNSHAASSKAILNIPVDMEIAAGEKVAYTIAYKPGNPYDEGDVIQFDANDPNQRNAFNGYYFADNTFYKEDSIYNHGLVANSSIRYDYSTTGWNGLFIPGVAFQGNWRHYDAGFLISSTVGVESVAALNKMVIAPNPVSAGFNAKIIIDLPNAENLKISIMDISGKQINASNHSFSSGKQQVNLDTNNLTPGIYFVTVEGNERRFSTSKLIVTK